MNIKPGMRVEVTTARDEQVVMVAVTGETNGRDIRVVWVSDEQDYAAHGSDAYAIPWPANAVRALTPA